MTGKKRKLRFDAFELDLANEELLRNGEPVRLAPQPFKVLALLASRSGQVVTREELQKSVWEDGVHVDFEGSLHSCIKQIRAALGDDRACPRFIETLPRRGYRFLLPLTAPRRAFGALALGVAAVALAGLGLTAWVSEEPPRAPEVEELTLKGRYLLKSGQDDALARAIAYFEESVSLDSEFAPAHIGLAEAHLRRAMGEGDSAAYAAAERSARRALALGSSAEAEFVLALARWYGAWDWAEAGEAFRRALRENQDFARAHHWYAYYLTGLGRHAEAIAEIERASALDPTSAEVQSDVGWFYYFAGRYEEAIQASLRTLELEPSFLLAQDCLLESRLARGEEEQALLEARRLLERAGVEADVTSLPQFWETRLERAVSSPNPFGAAVAALRLGRHDDALDWLRKAVEEKSLWSPVVDVDPRLDPIRPTPGFRAIRGALGLQ